MTESAAWLASRRAASSHIGVRREWPEPAAHTLLAPDLLAKTKLHLQTPITDQASALIIHYLHTFSTPPFNQLKLRSSLKARNRHNPKREGPRLVPCEVSQVSGLAPGPVGQRVLPWQSAQCSCKTAFTHKATFDSIFVLITAAQPVQSLSEALSWSSSQQ